MMIRIVADPNDPSGKQWKLYNDRSVCSEDGSHIRENRNSLLYFYVKGPKLPLLNSSKIQKNGIGKIDEIQRGRTLR